MLGSIIGAGAKLFGGILGDKATAKANKKNIQLQKDFAQQGIQWKVADARKAGIHPLYALGAQTHSFSPSVVGGTGLASGLASAGQDISRAVDANSSQSMRDRSYNEKVKALTLQKFGLENELLASQISRSRSAQINPPVPELGSGDLPVGRMNLSLDKGETAADDLEKYHGEGSELVTTPRFVKKVIQELIRLGAEDFANYGVWPSYKGRSLKRFQGPSNFGPMP